MLWLINHAEIAIVDYKYCLAKPTIPIITSINYFIIFACICLISNWGRCIVSIFFIFVDGGGLFIKYLNINPIKAKATINDALDATAMIIIEESWR